MDYEVWCIQILVQDVISNINLYGDILYLGCITCNSAIMI